MSNKPSYDHYIITASSEVSLLIKLRDIFLTVALWVVYLYFIRESWPFVVDLARWATNGFDDYTQYAQLAIIPTIQAYGQVAGVMTIIYLGWALYNMLRFRGRQRRKARASVAPEDLAALYGFSPDNVIEWQSAPSLLMHHDEHGHLTDVKVGK